MNKRPWMPLYVMEYLSDTIHLTPAESGAYIHLIIYYWVNGGLPKLPNGTCDENAIARITRLNSMSWAKSRDTLRAFFNNDWSHDRIERELAQVIEMSRRNRAKALLRHSRGTAAAHTHTHTHTKKDSVIGFEGSKEEAIDKEARKWIAQGTDQWRAWVEHFRKTKGVAPPITTSNNELGWWFESEFPQ